MNSRAMLGAGLLLLAALVAAWICGALGSSAPPPAMVVTAPSSPSSTSDVHHPEPPAAELGGLVRTAVGNDGEAHARHLRIVTVMPDGSPAAGAEVRYWPLRTQQERDRDEQALHASRDLEVVLRTSGRVALADAHGVVDIDAEADTKLCARLGEFYGELGLFAAEEPWDTALRLELHRDLTLRVEVVDTEGHACEGVAIQVEGKYASRRRGDDEVEFGLGRSDAHGDVVLAHSQLRLPEPGAEMAEWQAAVTLRTYGVSSPTIIEPADYVAQRAVRVTVPVGGAIEVAVVDADGSPMQALVRLSASAAAEPERSDQDKALGPHHFLQVPLGQRWRLMVEHAIDDVREQFIQGPTHAGDTVKVVVQLSARYWELHARMVDEHGRCWQIANYGADDFDERLSLECGPGDELVWSGWLPAATNSIDDFHFRARLPFDDFRTVRVDRVLHPGRTDLGDLVLPMRQGDQVLVEVEARCQGRMLTSQVTVGLLHQKTSCRCSGTSFVVQGQPPTDPMFLTCEYPDCVPTGPMRVQLGQHVVIELQPRAVLSIPVIPPEVPWREVTATLEPLEGTEWKDQTFVDEQRRLRWLRVPPGRYRLRILAGERLLHEEHELLLRPGSNTWPASGEPLDLRGRARAIFVGVSAADGGELPPADKFLFAVPAGAVSLPADRSRSSWPWFVPLDEPSDLVICADGFVPVRLRSPTRDAHVVMVRKTTLRFVSAQPGTIRLRMGIVQSGFDDPLLREADGEMSVGDLLSTNFQPDSGLLIAPGTVLEFMAIREDMPGPLLRVVVGDQSPQEVVLR